MLSDRVRMNSSFTKSIVGSKRKGRNHNAKDGQHGKKNRILTD